MKKLHYLLLAICFALSNTPTKLDAASARDMARIAHEKQAAEREIIPPPPAQEAEEDEDIPLPSPEEEEIPRSETPPPPPPTEEDEELAPPPPPLSDVSAWFNAAADGDLKTLQTLADDPSLLNKQDKNGETTLDKAALITTDQKSLGTGYLRDLIRNKEQVIQWLLSQHAAIGEKTLGIVLENIALPHLITALITAGADPNSLTSNNDSALILAAFGNNEPLTRFLLKKKINVNQQNKQGFTALHLAAQQGNKNITRMLLDAGASQSLTTNSGLTAEDLAVLDAHEAFNEFNAQRKSAVHEKEAALLAALEDTLNIPITFIKKDLLEKAAIPGTSTYWLTIPTVGTVLIKMKNYVWPALEKNGRASFDYISDTDTNHALPRGLYYWKGNQPGQVSNRPKGQMFVATKDGKYISTSPSPTQKGKAWNEAGHQQHPFALNIIPSLLETPAAHAKEASAQKIITEFSAVTNNILNQDFYVRHHSNKSNAMPLATRQKLFDAIAKQQFNKDIIALQEWSPKNSLVIPFSGIGDPTTGLFLSYNTTKFTTVISATVQRFKTPGATNRGFQYAVIQTKDDQPKTLGIINTHFQGGSGPSKDYNGFRTDQLNEIGNFIRSMQDVPYWVLCGDLNSNAQEAKLYILLIKSLIPLNMQDAELRTGAARPATSFEQTTKSMDYIFHTRNLERLNISYYPEIKTGQEVMQHNVQDKQQQFYSDHCVVSATFRFKN